MDELLTGKLTGFGGITTMKGSFNWSLQRPVTKIVAYWRNDKPGGYSCEIGDIPGHEEGWRKMVAMIVTAVHLLHHLQCTTSQVCDDLAAIAATSAAKKVGDRHTNHIPPTSQTITFIACLAYLIETKELIEDDFNGLIIQYGPTEEAKTTRTTPV